jgi:hypothetical protein
MKYGSDWMPRSLKTFENATTCKLDSVELTIRTGANFANDMMEGDLTPPLRLRRIQTRRWSSSFFEISPMRVALPLEEVITTNYHQAASLT